MSQLSDWRRNVIDACVTAYPLISEQPVSGYNYPTLKPQAPAVMWTPPASGDYVDFEESSFCESGHPQGRLLWLVSSRWEEAAFDAVDEIASTLRLTGARSREFTVVRIGAPGIVSDLGDALPVYLGLPVDIAGTYPIQ